MPLVDDPMDESTPWLIDELKKSISIYRQRFDSRYDSSRTDLVPYRFWF